MSDQLLIPSRFCGPPSSGNGGWVSGALAGLVPGASGDPTTGWPTIRVSLRRPPPLETPLSVATHEGVTTAVVGADPDAVVATAQPSEEALRAVPPVPAAQARAAMAAYPGHTSHPFATCFVCGTDRAPGDGLRIFPGPVADTDGATRVAAVWTPQSDPISLTTTWAALDCIGGWAGDLTERLMVLARMTARIDALPATGEEHVVVGGKRGQDGRKTFTAASLYAADGRLLGVAEHLWIAVDPATFGG